jgi:hypothetical protein
MKNKWWGMDRKKIKHNAYGLTDRQITKLKQAAISIPGWETITLQKKSRIFDYAAQLIADCWEIKPAIYRAIEAFFATDSRKHDAFSQPYHLVMNSKWRKAKLEEAACARYVEGEKPGKTRKQEN